MTIKSLQEYVYKIAESKGWHEQKNPFGQAIANMHGELSEAWEWWRKHNPVSDHIPPYNGIEEEFADVIIRILDIAEEMGLDIDGAIQAKCIYNKTREYRQGGKKA